MLIRVKPASANGFATFSSVKAFVVIVKVGAFSIAFMRATISTISGRRSGSPPVKRTSLIPSLTAISITRTNSSVVS